MLTNTNKCSQTCACKHVLAKTCSQTHFQTRTCQHALASTCSPAHARKHTLASSCSKTHIHKYPLTNTHSHKHSFILARTLGNIYPGERWTSISEVPRFRWWLHHLYRSRQNCVQPWKPASVIVVQRAL